MIGKQLLKPGKILCNNLMFYINNIKVKYKLFIIYILCILLPIIVINTIFLNMITQNIKNDEIQNLYHEISRASTILKNSMEGAIKLANKLYSSRGLNEAMETEYHNDLRFVSEYYSYFKPTIMDFVPYYTQLTHINIYTDNKTMLNSNGIKILDMNKDREWYDSLDSKDSNDIVLTTYAYFEPPFNKPKKRVTMLRRMDYYSSYQTYEKIIKIDFSENLFGDIVSYLNFSGTIIIVDEFDRIVFSNNPMYYTHESSVFFTLDMLDFDKDSIIIQHDFEENFILSGWKIQLIQPVDTLYEKLGDTRQYVFVLMFISLFVSTMVILFISQSFYTRLDILSRQMKKLEGQDFETLECTSIGNDEIGSVIRTYNKLTMKIRELIEDVYQSRLREQNIELERKDAELRALQTQVNPHYLINVLETIRMKMVLKGDSDTSSILKHISKSIRKMITWDGDFCKVSDEVDIIKSFLKIQHYRFDDEISYTINVDEDIKEFRIPRLCFQPLVENAFIHGVNGLNKKVVVNIEIYRQDDFICFEVWDNGRGIDTQRLTELRRDYYTPKNNKSIGISNITRRLTLYYGNSYSFNIDSIKDDYTKIQLKIPLNSSHSSMEVL